MQDHRKPSLREQIDQLPTVPGVYLFKDDLGIIVYIGKAKNLRARVRHYIQKGQDGFKASRIVQDSVDLEHIPTKTELEAMLLEAKLIQSHQPKHNVIFKSGQPFLWIMITNDKLPELMLVRTRKKKGSYFGPFIDKGSVRRVYDFLMKTFQLKLCHKKISGGCLYYHMHMCAGFCKGEGDFDAYMHRLELARQALKQGHKKFLEYLAKQIYASNQALTFERSRELHRYYQAFEQVFISLQSDYAGAQARARKDIWVLTPDKTALYLFAEQESVLKKKQLFVQPYEPMDADTVLEYLSAYYAQTPPAAMILLDRFLEYTDLALLEDFLRALHKDLSEITLLVPVDGHYASLVRMAVITAEQAQKRQMSLGKMLKTLLELPQEPKSIDCFDVSHKQGTHMVGSCIRFIGGHPAADYFRRFSIKTVDQQDDYACLQELVARRYQKEQDLPDLIMIDGGKGQLNAVQHLIPMAEFISLAKREETIFSKRFMEGKVLDQSTYAAQVLIALRDYAHHFAISYHRSLARKVR